MNARSHATQVADELNRRGVPVVAEQHNTTLLAAIHHPYLDGPTAFILVVSEDGTSSWHAAERTATDEYAAAPSRLDQLPSNAPASDVADAIQHCLDNRPTQGNDPIATIETLRANHSAEPMLVVLRGDPSACNAVAAQWTNTVADQFSHLFCVDVNNYIVYDVGSLVDIRRIFQHLLHALGSPLPDLRHDDHGYARELHRLYHAAITGHRVLVHLHNASEPAQARWLTPSTPGSVLLITARQSMRELHRDNACFLDI